MRTLLSLFLVSFLMSARVEAGPAKDWSILWVVDNSASMQTQRATLAKKAGDFIRRLQAQGVRNFRMAVTTTDFITLEGSLVAAANGNKVAHSSSADPAGDFAAIVNAVSDSSTSFWEQGLESAHQAIAKEGNAFLKDGDRLAVIYVTDEDDYSCEKDCFGVEPEHNPNWKAYPLKRYLLAFSELRTKRNIETTVFPIVGVLEGTCAVASYGVRYAKIRSQVGGLTASICPVEFEKSLVTVADYMTSTDAPSDPAVLVNPIVLPEAKPGQAYSADLSPFVAGSGTLIFSKMAGPSWLMMTADGTVMGTPTASQIGQNSFQAKVCNQTGACASFEVRITVVAVNHAPKWAANPLPLGQVKANQPATWDLGPFIHDPDGDSLTCSANSLPSWLTFRNCLLAGTPKAADVGKFQVNLRVTDSSGNTSETKAIGTVTAR